jgi:16S rRNA G966 N2-methylase RsmD
VVEANLAYLGVTSSAFIINREAVGALKRLGNEPEKFDIVFFDPPYASDIYTQVMRKLGGGDLLAPEAIVVAEHRAKAPPEAEYHNLSIYRVVKQGESALAFYANMVAES